MELIINKKDNCNAFISDNCEQLNNKKNLIFDLNNNISISYTNQIRGNHGLFERYSQSIDNISRFLNKTGHYRDKIKLLETVLVKIKGNGRDYPNLFIEHKFDFHIFKIKN